MPTCAVDRVVTAQNSCRPRITTFDRAIAVIDTSDLTVDRDYTVVDGLGRKQVFACTEYDWFGRQRYNPRGV